MIRRFIINDSSNPEYVGNVFEIRTEIKKIVSLPFTDEEYRCTMFNGIQVKLVNGEEYIIGDLY